MDGTNVSQCNLSQLKARHIPNLKFIRGEELFFTFINKEELCKIKQITNFCLETNLGDLLKGKKLKRLEPVIMKLEHLIIRQLCPNMIINLKFLIELQQVNQLCEEFSLLMSIEST